MGVRRAVHFGMDSGDYCVFLPLVELEGADLFVFLAEKSKYVLGFSNFNIFHRSELIRFDPSRTDDPVRVLYLP